MKSVKEKNPNKVNVFQSILFKICCLTLMISLFSCIMMYITYAPNMQSNMNAMSQHYIEDLAISYGTSVAKAVVKEGGKVALSPDSLKANLAGVGMTDMQSSYLYVVSKDGTMLYHPTAEKIGKPVENEAVKKVLAEIKANGGSKPIEPKVIKYVFKGETKFAATFVDEKQSFILVATVDEKEILTPVTRSNTQGIICFILVVVIGLALSIAIATFIIKPIQAMMKKTLQLANMDLTDDGSENKLLKRKDEIGKMAIAINRLQSELRNVVVAIKESSDALGRSAEDLSADATETNSTMDQVRSAVGDIANAATSQADETQDATENVIVMGNMVEATGDQVQKLVESAEIMNKANQHAMTIVNDLKEISSKTDEYIDIISNQTDTTNNSAIRISEAARMIADIAEETNLLALNASIEAARAGEQGKGFAVVASEIQKLAEQSTDVTKQIDQIISMLIKDSDRAVETMGQVKAIIEEQNKHMARTDEAFHEISEEVSAALSGMNTISNQTGELDSARVNVVDIVNSLTAIAEENAAATEETSASVDEIANIVTNIAKLSDDLSHIAREMEEKMSIFKM